MLIRERLENQEFKDLSPYAAFSIRSKGRQYPEEPCDIRTVYQRDRDRILHSKAFRRLKDKTQVFLSPRGDHYRTRLTHTLEVSQNARTIAKALRLNEELVEAIALGHDLGHTPFGHAGEKALNEVCPLGFQHHEQSVRTVELLEKKGVGLNLTWETRDGILNHQMSAMPHTLEGKVVRLSDKIAYIHHDMDDAIRAGIISEADIPEELKSLGSTCNERLGRFTRDLIMNSLEKDDVSMSPEIYEKMRQFRAFMYERVYTDKVAKAEEGKAEVLVARLYEYFLKNIDRIPEDYILLIYKGEPRERVVCDYIAAMTDRFATDLYTDLFIPKSWVV